LTRTHASSIEFRKADAAIDLVSDDNFKMSALWEILQTRLVRPASHRRTRSSATCSPHEALSRSR